MDAKMDLQRQPHPPLLGISIDGPAPLGASDIHLVDGVTVLYGLNGIGKSRILEQMTLALNGRGESENSWVHFRLDMSSLIASRDEDMEDSFGVELKHALALTMGTRFRHEIDVIFSDLEVQSILSMTETLVSTLVDDDQGLIEEVTSQGYFSLRPVGGDRPMWEAWISFLPNDDTPRLRFACDNYFQIRDLASSLRGSVDSGELDGNSAYQAIYARIEQIDGEAKELGFPNPDIAYQLTQARFGSRAPWAPIPLVPVGRIDLPTGFTTSLDDRNDVQNLSEQSLLLLRKLGPIVEVASENEVEETEDAKGLLLQLSQRADRYLEGILSNDAPVVACKVSPWGVAPPLHWTASERFSSSDIAIGSLGSGRSRWAIMAAWLAVADLNRAPDPDSSELCPSLNDRVVIIDEPELGLHPTAVTSMFQGLKQWSQGRSVVVATHSPVPFGDRDVQLVHVTRDELGLIVCRSMGGDLQALLQTQDSDVSNRAMKNLGLGPGDVLQTIRKFVIVEGEHDKAVFEAVFGRDELATARIQILPMRGTNNLMSVLGAQLMFDFTSAEILIVLDNTRGPHFASVWDAARKLHDAGDVKHAVDRLRELESGSPEEKKLYEFCKRAINSNERGRIGVFGLTKPDVINYLPASEFVSGVGSWDDVVREWDGRGSFKDYLRDRGANISARRLGKLAEQLDVLDPDFVELGSQLFAEA